MRFVPDQIGSWRDRPEIWGIMPLSKGQVGVSDPVKSMPKPGTERAVVDRATNLEQQIGAFSRPSHLLRLVHTTVDQEIRCAFDNRRPDPLSGPESFGIVDQP